MNGFWDVRYDTEDYIYGKAPNGFFADSLKGLTAGKILLPGEGEGRNSVHAALNGWDAEAFDQSAVAARKAEQLANLKGVKVTYTVATLETFAYETGVYDAAGLVFVHASEDSRKYLHRKVTESLKPGGRIILEAFHMDQLGRSTGGPQHPGLLYTREILEADFSPLQALLLEETEVHLDEGPYHNGAASVIRYIGQKP